MLITRSRLLPQWYKRSVGWLGKTGVDSLVSYHSCLPLDLPPLISTEKTIYNLESLGCWSRKTIWVVKVN